MDLTIEERAYLVDTLEAIISRKTRIGIAHYQTGNTLHITKLRELITKLNKGLPIHLILRR